VKVRLKGKPREGRKVTGRRSLYFKVDFRTGSLEYGKLLTQVQGD